MNALRCRFLLGGVAIFLLGGCAARVPPGRMGMPLGRETGLASWYGNEFHGRLAASGERFNQFDLTAAHRTLPFGTRLHVTNVKNGRNVYVTVNDRGPFVEGRILDLSLGAAKILDMIPDGVTTITYEVVGSPTEPLPTEPSAKNGVYMVQVGSFQDEENAKRMQHRLRSYAIAAHIAAYTGQSPPLYRVQIGPFLSREEAQSEARRLLVQLARETIVPIVVKMENSPS